MEYYEVPNMVISTVYTAIQVALAVLMYKKMKETGLKNLVHLFLVYVMMAAVAMFMPFQSIFIAILQPLSAILILPFVKMNFYDQKRSWFKAMFVLSIFLHGCAVVLKLTREWFKNQLAIDPPELFIAYNLVVFAVFLIPYGWLAAVCIRTRAVIASEGSVEPWIVKRYDLVTLSAMLIIVATSIPLLFYTDMAFHSGIIAKLVLSVLFLGFSVVSYFAWFMPDRTKHFFNDRHLRIHGALPPTSRDVHSIDSTTRLDTTRISSIIDFLGNKLAKAISKTPAAAKGLLLVAIDTESAILNRTDMNIRTLCECLTNELKKKLNSLGFSNAHDITTSLVDELKKHQSLILMQAL